MGCIAGSPAYGLDLARRRPRFPDPVAVDQIAVLDGVAEGEIARKPCGAARAGDLAAPLLGASYPGRSGFSGACAVLLDQPGEAWIGRSARGLAVFVGASGYVGCVISRTFGGTEVVRASTHPTMTGQGKRSLIELGWPRLSVVTLTTCRFREVLPR